MITVTCKICGCPCQGSRISEAMEARRFHEEQYHREGKIETDTSGR